MHNDFLLKDDNKRSTLMGGKTYKMSALEKGETSWREFLIDI